MFTLCLLLILSNIALLVQVSLGWRHWHYLLAVGFVSIGLILLFLWRYRRRKIVCRNCRRELVLVPRPLALNYGYLSRKGLIFDGAFYSLRHRWPLKKVWMKLTRWTQACHRCKLLEKNHISKFVPLLPEELDKLERAVAIGEEPS